MNDDSPWEYKPDGNKTAQAPALPNSAQPTGSSPKAKSQVITWSASEYIDHSRGVSWYLMLALAAVALAAIVYLLTKDYFGVGVIVVLAIIVGIFTTHKPKQVEYELSNSGLRAADKNYPFTMFKSFTVIHEGALSSFSLVPIKRFMPPLTIYFDPASETKMVELLGSHLPYEEGGLDPVERLASRLRF